MRNVRYFFICCLDCYEHALQAPDGERSDEAVSLITYHVHKLFSTTSFWWVHPMDAGCYGGASSAHCRTITDNTLEISIIITNSSQGLSCTRFDMIYCS